MNKQLILTILGLSLHALSLARCGRLDRHHINAEVTRCPYLQENIYRAFAQKPGQYGELEKYRKCFYCECPISEHGTEVKQEVVKKKREVRIIDNSLTHG